MRTQEIPGLAIHYDVAQGQMQQLEALEKSTRHHQAVALNEFRNGFHDATDMRDLVHWMNATGKDMRWLFRHAKFKDPRGPLGAMVTAAQLDGDIEMQEFILLNCFQ